jgi:hypothetical protein
VKDLEHILKQRLLDWRHALRVDESDEVEDLDNFDWET